MCTGSGSRGGYCGGSVSYPRGSRRGNTKGVCENQPCDPVCTETLIRTICAVLKGAKLRFTRERNEPVRNREPRRCSILQNSLSLRDVDVGMVIRCGYLSLISFCGLLFVCG